MPERSGKGLRSQYAGSRLTYVLKAAQGDGSGFGAFLIVYGTLVVVASRSRGGVGAWVTGPLTPCRGAAEDLYIARGLGMHPAVREEVGA